ncbi:helix-turn-helix domain-containing protein [Achromobacter kerstersii]|uniref:helix-turn-helix domain-containing protein n=1 Tax=Achromobacter kerstersii TaxID=1353890 RepID=UPI0015F2C962|nr:helix-turn-helix domain-containing protein [Achromobacter kerstersii]
MDTDIQDKKPSPLQEKWGEEILELGFVLVPTLLLRKQKDLGLESTELVVLLNLLSTWWVPERNPFPRTATIAQRMHVTQRTVQRCLKTLEDKGFIAKNRVRTGTPEEMRTQTSYEMSGTVRKLAAAKAGVVAGPQKQKTRRRAGSVEKLAEGQIAVPPNYEAVPGPSGASSGKKVVVPNREFWGREE